MLRLSTRLNAKSVNRALSAVTGNAYPPDMSAKLCALGFPSELWLTEKQMASFGVTVADPHKGKGYNMTMTSGASVVLYNAKQTTDPERVEQMKGRFAVYNAVTGERMMNSTVKGLEQHNEKFSSGEWLSDQDVDMLSLKLKPDAKPILVTYELHDTVAGNDGKPHTETRTLTRGYYNRDQVDGVDALQRARKILPVSVSTGRRYQGNALRALLRAALERGYESPFWLTMQNAQAMGLMIKNPEMCVEVGAGEHKVVSLYNACETTDAQKVATAAYNAKFAPRSGVTGATYPQSSQVVLKAAAMKNRFRSTFWLTKKQASVLGVSIRENEEPTSIMTDTGSIDLFNAEQTNGKEIIAARFGRDL